MKCPACFNSLTEIRVEGIALDVCEGGCGGVWFDAFELQRLEKLAANSNAAIGAVARNPAIKVDASRKRDCPRCMDIKLGRHYFSARRRVEVDQCPNCGGYWLDAGELESIRREQAETAASAEARDAGVSLAAIRHLYRLKTGQSPEP
jgi:Zn-finger nucleic acid-binding protein